MALSTTTNTISYTGDGVTTVFALPYLTFSTTHVFVSLDDVPQVSGFTVSSLPAEGGNPNVTFSVAPANGVVVLLQRIVPETQTSVYTVAGPFPAKATEKNLDLLMMAIQQKSTQITNITQVLDTLPDTTDPNNFGKGVKVKEDGTGYSTFIIDPGGGGGGGGGATVQPWGVVNLSLQTSVAANALTVAFKTAVGANPSLADPIVIQFPTASGGYSSQSITAPMSITIPSGSHLGGKNATTTRIYIGVGLDGTTVLPFVYNPFRRALDTATIQVIDHLPLVEQPIHTLTSVGGPMLTPKTLWSLPASSGLPNRSIRVLGFVDSFNATTGTWTDAGSPVLKTARVPDSGTLIRRAYVRNSAASGNSVPIPFDNTIPQQSEGTFLQQLEWNQLYKANPTIFTYSYMVSVDTVTTVTLAGFLNTTADAFMANARTIDTTNSLKCIEGSMTQTEIPAGLQKWNIHIGPSAVFSVRVNSTSSTSAGIFGQTAASSASIDELMV